MILFSDVHLRAESAEVVLGEVLPGIRAACVAAGEKQAACLGDFLHFRYRVDARILNGVLDEFRLWQAQGINLHLLPGNHDQYEINGRNALEVFGELPLVTVYTEPTWTQWGYWLPYRKERQALAQALDTTAPTGMPRILFAHVPVMGAYMNDNMHDTEGVPRDWLKGWTQVFLGHYHRRQNLSERICYVGSPYQTRADESNQVKGYARWRYNNQPVEWFNADWGPKYHRLRVEAGQQVDLRGVQPRDEVRVRVTGPGAERAAEHVYKTMAGVGLRGTVTPELEHAAARLSVADGEGLAAYVRAYVDAQPEGLPVGRVLEVFREITGMEVAP